MAEQGPKAQAEKLKAQNRKLPRKYNVKTGDSWFKIAQRIYGDGRMAQELARANAGVNMLHGGMVIKIPGQVRNPYVSQSFMTPGTAQPAAQAAAVAPAAQPTQATASTVPVTNLWGDAPGYIPPGYQYQQPAAPAAQKRLEIPARYRNPLKQAPKQRPAQKGYGNYRGGTRAPASPDAPPTAAKHRTRNTGFPALSPVNSTRITRSLIAPALTSTSTERRATPRRSVGVTRADEANQPDTRKDNDMSAFVVSNKHIDALLTYAQRPQYGDPARYIRNKGDDLPYDQRYESVTFYDNLDTIGQMLVDQNYASVNYRYDDSEVPPIYKYKPYHLPLSPVQVIKACDCWRYQSCENPNHQSTEAWTVVDYIRERAIHDLPGMDDAKWVIV